jgi:hypothetical protein
MGARGSFRSIYRLTMEFVLAANITDAVLLARFCLVVRLLVAYCSGHLWMMCKIVTNTNK